MALLTVAEAQAAILSTARVTSAEDLPLAEAQGRSLAAPVIAPFSQPPFTASAMDGYALKAADLTAGTATFRVVGESRAGERFAGKIKAGEAIRIFTGAPMPDDADTVVIQENTSASGDLVSVVLAPTAGANVRPGGIDFAEGREVAVAGDLLHWRRLALIAATGIPSVTVHRRPRVALIASGDELRLPGEPRGPDEIYASSVFAVAAYVRDCGGEPLVMGLAPDILDDMRASIRRSIELGADVICMLGGASVGDHDLTRHALKAEGADMDFWKIAMRPGKPMMFGRIGDRSVMGLPGNPVSTMACTVLYLGPLVRAMTGNPHPLPPVFQAIAGADIPGNDVRQDHIRATLHRSEMGEMVATPFRLQDSSVQSVMAAADVLIIRPADCPPTPRGAPVSCIAL